MNSNALPSSYDNNLPIVNVIGTITEQPNIKLPVNISIPNGHEFDFLLFASGVQIYKCFVNKDIPNNWTLVMPDAYLVNDKRNQPFTPVVHHHFIQEPINGGKVVWESIIKKDNSLVVAKDIAQNVSPNGPGNVLWLVLQVTHHEGKGRFSDITYVLRVLTLGGVEPADDKCGTLYPDGAIVKIPYQSEYWFIK
ncbi:hypothetical protein RclHR1_00490023 [Rhizophagus clarus]|uniref:DUF3455 domain-containing protein n=1 Tax=Rhizophagus clarus TaxID=94130 RepID=A0A2Z6SCZ2_9GLOM|nr:hypothetical protein RclHR1_00490023 [Rhizophagus clarus]GES80624.1 DUF3455 domain-containing protein [Rhizophagus clarus]